MILCGLVISVIHAQNVQFHYDFSREYLTTTVEDFKSAGSSATLWFIDVDYRDSGGASSCYFEFHRDQNIAGPLALTIQYYDGFTTDFSLNPVWVAGLQYLFGSLPVELALRSEKGFSPTFQTSIVWDTQVSGGVHLNGFLYLWRNPAGSDLAGTTTLFSEPQIWYPVNGHLSIGGELEISRNFPASETVNNTFKPHRWVVLPTLGLKWIY